MIPRPAQYFLRCDDLCPTASRQRWQRFLSLIEEFGIQPILAVVPENRDPILQLSPPDPEFWKRIRALEASGASIGLHGYRHLAKSRGRSLLALHRTTEFAGVPEDTQRQWIHAGLEILRGHGLNPRIWVAPRHGFDAPTLRALLQEGIDVLSDGFARVPHRRGGMIWIPQQLWEPAEKSQGLWTI
jgi:predicted deacetylase